MATNGAGRRVANRYELTDELGHGGMGVVWRATDTLLARQVALKEVDLPRGRDAEEREGLRARVTREARAAPRPVPAPPPRRRLRPPALPPPSPRTARRSEPPPTGRCCRRPP